MKHIQKYLTIEYFITRSKNEAFWYEVKFKGYWAKCWTLLLAMMQKIMAIKQTVNISWQCKETKSNNGCKRNSLDLYYLGETAVPLVSSRLY